MIKKIVLIGGLIVIVLGVIFGLPLYNLHYSKIDGSEDQIIYIPTGSSLADVAAIIDETGVIEESTFLDYAGKLDFTDEKVEPGKYQITGGMKVKELVYALKNGNQEIKDTRITFSFCRDVYEMAGEVAPAIEADSAEIADYIMSSETISKYGFKEETICAMFLPDTYEVGEWDMSAEEFVQFMADQFKEFWSNEGEGRGNKLKELNLSQSQVSTLASILEAEQGLVTDEWPKIAGLYLNRVKDGWKLQSDPTAKFCWGDSLKGVQRLLDEHMKKDCPYNTYIYPGLPPGPIRIPSKKAIDAVLNAEKHNYYYMCAAPNNTGLHNFAETYSQHMANARLWWKYADERGY
ncbi:endolytic transglycosylase MltG [Paracrocinitomix mangrovi]|uniref:endolytic transglycosylase MltG n=1 Tax=Paracrocinitomix mangrovi TaxID=2862509 RepID=UPI001C8E6534|nr:endolytic transglycosylase MltG [Paracrocinitomix mangrovi]UKN01850.1 endolytic transglycosylase MltG [Paracrocinitomix mangrovi]